MTYQPDEYEKRSGRIKFIIGTQYRNGTIIENPIYFLPKEVHAGKLKEHLGFITSSIKLRFLWVKSRNKIVGLKDLREHEPTVPTLTISQVRQYVE